MKRKYVICIKPAKNMKMWQPREHGDEISVPKMQPMRNFLTTLTITLR